jgi:glutathione S-transferase
MSDSNAVVLYHIPQSRSTATLNLLEEMRIPYALRLLNKHRSEQRLPDYLAVNPMGKVPAISHCGTLVTEQVAIFLYLADMFPENGMAPSILDPLRGDYLRWMVYYAACFEPAVIDRAMKRDAGPQMMSGYGDFDTVLSTVTGQLGRGPWLLGERFTAADVLWGQAMNWQLAFGLLPRDSVITEYAERTAARPVFQRVMAHDAELAAQHEAQATAD